MKKTLVALAALAATAAFAQSSVTLYGVGDAFIGNSKTTIDTGGVVAAGGAVTSFGTVPATGNGVAQNVISNGGLSGSRFGLKGAEDLGGGLKASFQFENGFNLDDGAPNAGGGMFGRQAYIGLSGGFGTFNVGRMYPMYDQLRGGSDPMGHSAFSATAGSGWGGIGRDYGFRINNAWSYDTPNFNGFSAGITYGLGENKTATISAGNVLSLKGVYANGPIMVGLGYQEEKNVAAVNGQGVSLAAAALGTVSKEKHALLTGSYDFGVAKVRLAFNKSGDNGVAAVSADKEFAIGVSMPLGAFGFAAEYAASKNSDVKGNALGMQGTYALSKRTDVYAGLRTLKGNSLAAGPVTNIKSNLIGLGLRHTF